MIKSTIMLCAEGIVRDTESNNISVFNILEQFTSEGFPLFIQKFYVFNYLERELADPSQIDCQVIITNNNAELASVPIHIDFLDKLRNRAIVTVNGLAILNPGRLTARMMLNGVELGSYKIDVVSSRPPEIIPEHQ
ncbi:MAG: hypothetical protein PHI59_08545 [Candidatus Omnitrophica bacterium]|nr:hypothetical protein [Candidatus Omnitrophota bacterium]